MNLSFNIELGYVYVTLTLIVDLKLILVLVCNCAMYAIVTLKLVLELWYEIWLCIGFIYENDADFFVNFRNV